MISAGRFLIERRFVKGNGTKTMSHFSQVIIDAILVIVPLLKRGFRNFHEFFQLIRLFIFLVESVYIVVNQTFNNAAHRFTFKRSDSFQSFFLFFINSYAHYTHKYPFLYDILQYYKEFRYSSKINFGSKSLLAVLHLDDWLK